MEIKYNNLITIIYYYFNSSMYITLAHTIKPLFKVKLWTKLLWIAIFNEHHISHFHNNDVGFSVWVTSQKENSN